MSAEMIDENRSTVDATLAFFGNSGIIRKARIS